MTDSARFHNAIRILLNLGQHDLAAAGVIDSNWGSAEASDRDQVEAFMDDPIREALRMPDANYERLFALIESRQKPKDLSAFDLLCRCFDAFDGEEESVREEHADLIEEVEAFIELHRPPVIADPGKAGVAIARLIHGESARIVQPAAPVLLDVEDRSGECAP